MLVMNDGYLEMVHLYTLINVVIIENKRLRTKIFQAAYSISQSIDPRSANFHEFSSEFTIVEI